jgi:VWFA-related protein
VVFDEEGSTFVSEQEGRMSTSTYRRISLVLFGSLLSAAFAAAQQTPLATPTTSGKVVLDVVVSPRSGQPVANLHPQDFTLLDNKTTRPITSFRALSQGQEPTQVILVIDNVNTPYQTIAYARPLIEKFLRANDGHLAYPTSLAVVNDGGTQIQAHPTTDGNALSASLDQYEVGLKFLRRDTGYWGAASRSDIGLRALNSLMARDSDRPGRKIILWISPGWPLLSGPRLDLPYKQEQQIFSTIVALSNELRTTHTTLYDINPIGAGESVLRSNYYEDFVKGVSKPAQVVLGDLSLQVLATQSGGQVLYANNDITALLRKAMADTSAYYELTFDAPPAERPNEYHQIQVQVSSPGLSARALQGYYAQPLNAEINPSH